MKNVDVTNLQFMHALPFGRWVLDEEDVSDMVERRER